MRRLGAIVSGCTFRPRNDERRTGLVMHCSRDTSMNMHTTTITDTSTVACQSRITFVVDESMKPLLYRCDDQIMDNGA
jgi:hypothetical protein